MPTFSVIIPVYRAEKYLNRCIDSILNQSYADFELILVDDGSPDMCPGICDEYSQRDARVKVIHKENNGATSARKAGVKIAKGKYVCYVDADDYIESNYLEKMASADTDLTADIICCGAVFAIGENDKKVPMYEKEGRYLREDIESLIFPRLLQTENASYFAPAYWAKAIKTELIAKNIDCLNEAIRIGEDGACIIACVYEAKIICVIKDCLYHYCDNPASVTKSGKAFSWDDPMLIAEHLQKSLDLSQYNFREQYYRKITHELFTVVRSRFNLDSSYREICKDIKENLNKPIYREAVVNSKFKGLSANAMKYALQYKLFFLIWLFQKLK